MWKRGHQCNSSFGRRLDLTAFASPQPPSHTHTHTHTHTLKARYLKLDALYFSKRISVGCTSLALFSPGHPEMFPSPTWLSASTESLSSLLGRRGADCLDPRRVPWLRSQHQTRSFCAVCSVLTMQRGEPEKVPEPRVLEAAGWGCALGREGACF